MLLFKNNCKNERLSGYRINLPVHSLIYFYTTYMSFIEIHLAVQFYCCCLSLFF